MTPEEMSTDDIWMAAWLLVMDVPLLRTELEYGLCRFYFDDTDGQATRHAREYRNGNPSAPVREVLNAAKRVRKAVAEARGRAA